MQTGLERDGVDRDGLPGACDRGIAVARGRPDVNTCVGINVIIFRYSTPNSGFVLDLGSCELRHELLEVVKVQDASPLFTITVGKPFQDLSNCKPNVTAGLVTPVD